MREKNKEIIEKLKLKTGNSIKIIDMRNHPELKGKIGKIVSITSDYTLQGTWGNYDIVPFVDKFVKLG